MEGAVSSTPRQKKENRFRGPDGDALAGRLSLHSVTSVYRSPCAEIILFVWVNFKMTTGLFSSKVNGYFSSNISAKAALFFV